MPLPYLQGLIVAVYFATCHKTLSFPPEQSVWIYILHVDEPNESKTQPISVIVHC